MGIISKMDDRNRVSIPKQIIKGLDHDIGDVIYCSVAGDNILEFNFYEKESKYSFKIRERGRVCLSHKLIKEIGSDFNSLEWKIKVRDDKVYLKAEIIRKN